MQFGRGRQQVYNASIYLARTSLTGHLIYTHTPDVVNAELVSYFSCEFVNTYSQVRALNHAREEPPRHAARIRLPLLRKHLAHLRVLRARAAHANRDRPHPPRGPHECGRDTPAERPAGCEPCTLGEVRRGEARDDEERAGVGGVADVRVETARDEGVCGVDGEVEGEEGPEGREAVEADVGAEEDGEDADEGERGKSGGEG